ncbi:unnamed protein product [Blepharisma stoltei]|uniref:Ion transport domain-containing protein n=1 Tax=Blepharisma stoltei TaxID=1481888 RepID=A0AAU9JBS2_9CILI|nr:unnamed protein product [Blepharisma stoltei]
MELKDFKIPLLSNFNDIIDFSGTGMSEEEPQVTMEDAVKEIECMINDSLAQSYTMMDEIISVRVTNDEKSLVYITETDLVIWDRQSKERKNKQLPFVPQYLELCKGDKIALVSRRGETKINAYGIPGLEFMKVLDTHKSKIKNMFLSPNQRILVTPMEEEEVLKWDLDTLGRSQEVTSEEFEMASFSHNSERVLLINDKKVALYPLNVKYAEVSAEQKLESSVISAKFAPSDSFIALFFKQSIKMINSSSLEPICDIPLQESIRTAVIAQYEDIIVMGTESGKVIVFDNKNKRDLINMTVHNSPVTHISLSNDEKMIFSTEVEQKKKVFYTKFPELNLYKRIDKSSGILGFSPMNSLFAKFSREIKMLDLKTNEETLLGEIVGVQSVIYAGSNKIVICHNENISVINNETSERKMVSDKIDLDTPVCAVANQEGNLLFTGGKQKIKVWDLELVDFKSEWKAHEDIVTCLLMAKNDTRLISGSQDNQIKIWEYVEGVSELAPLQTLFGHLGVINSIKLTIDEKYLISGGSDKTMRIWNWEAETLLVTLVESDEVTGLYATQDGKYIISSSNDGKINYWSTKTFTKIFYNQVQANSIKKLFVSPNEAYIAFILQAGDCYAVANPLASKTMTVSGPNMDYYAYLRYLKSIINLVDIPDHTPSMDDWVILPYFLTAPHFYTYSNLSAYLRSSLETEFKTVESSFGETTLSISMDKDYRDCRNIIMKSMIKNYRDNPFAVACVTKECFIQLNKEGSRFLVKLYDLIFRRCVGYNLPKMISSSQGTPAYFRSKDVIPYAVNFFPPKVKPAITSPAEVPDSAVAPYDSATPGAQSGSLQDDKLASIAGAQSSSLQEDNLANINAGSGVVDLPEKSAGAGETATPPAAAPEEVLDKSVFFMHSLVPFNISAGSIESIEFLKSTLDSPNQDIFRTKFIQSILQGKWKQVRWLMYTQGLLYVLYLVTLSLFVLYWQDNQIMLVIPFVLSIILTSYEVYQAVLSPIDYLEDIWNYIDISRAVLFIVYTIMNWTDGDESVVYTFLMVTSFISWVRGISYFRLYPPTRYMVNLLSEVFKDMMSFLILLFYSTLAFSFIFLVLDVPTERDSLMSYVSYSYLINLGTYSLDGMTYMQSLMFFIVTMINQVVMMNLLISIVGDTHDRVQESLEIADNMELAEMILEVETLCFWKRNVKDDTYLQICLEDEYGEGAGWAGKVRELKVMMKGIKEAQAKAAVQSSEEVKEIREQIFQIEKSVMDDNLKLKEYIEQIKKNQLEIMRRMGK